jgi:hypothetical protein
MPPRLLAGTLALLALAGCCSNPHGHGGQLVTELGPADRPAVDAAPYKATYALYRWRKPPEGTVPQKWIPDQEVEQLYLRGLARWDKVGFERNDGGQLFAVAGEEKIPLPDGHYCWHVTPETEYRGMERILHEAGENTLTLVGLPFAVAGSALFLAMLPVTGVMFLLMCAV